MLAGGELDLLLQNPICPFPLDFFHSFSDHNLTEYPNMLQKSPCVDVSDIGELASWPYAIQMQSYGSSPVPLLNSSRVIVQGLIPSCPSLLQIDWICNNHEKYDFFF